jgi:hypothetical protein
MRITGILGSAIVIAFGLNAAKAADCTRTMEQMAASPNCTEWLMTCGVADVSERTRSYNSDRQGNPVLDDDRQKLVMTAQNFFNAGPALCKNFNRQEAAALLQRIKSGQ